MPSLTELPFSQMLDGGAEPPSSPASRAGVGEGEGEGLARGAGGPGQAAGRAGSVVETQRALLLRFRLLLLLTLQGKLGVVQMEGDTVSDSLPLLLSALCSVSSVVSDCLQPRGLWSARVICPGISPGKNMERVGIPSSGGSSYPVIEPQPPASPASAGGLFTTRPPGKPCLAPGHILICVFPKPGLSVAGAEGQACESKTSACG